jgi:hypothetical protein
VVSVHGICDYGRASTAHTQLTPPKDFSDQATCGIPSVSHSSVDLEAGAWKSGIFLLRFLNIGTLDARQARDSSKLGFCEYFGRSICRY